jgi:hypothetical protein
MRDVLVLMLVVVLQSQSCSPPFLHSGPMSHQQEQQQNQEEDDQEGDQPLLQQPHSQVAMTPDVQLVFLLFSLILQIIDNYIVEELAPCYNCIPYYTSALSGEHWVQELLARHLEIVIMTMNTISWVMQ